MEKDLDVKDISSQMKESSEVTPKDKVKQQNRIRQLAFKARKRMPKDYKSFCLVTEHFFKNAHRYWNIGEEEARKIKIEAESEVGKKSDDAQSVTVSNECIEVNKALRTIRALKKQKRIREQQDLVVKLRAGVGSYQDISKSSGTALKTGHEWCSTPKDTIHKLTSKANLCGEEFINFLMQDTITFSCSSKRLTGKRFMVDTWAEIYKKYLEQPQFHTHCVVSKSTL